jgi:hypothetical protein
MDTWRISHAHAGRHPIPGSPRMKNWSCSYKQETVAELPPCGCNTLACWGTCRAPTHPLSRPPLTHAPAHASHSSSTSIHTGKSVEQSLSSLSHSLSLTVHVLPHLHLLQLQGSSQHCGGQVRPTTAQGGHSACSRGGQGDKQGVNTVSTRGRTQGSSIDIKDGHSACSKGMGQGPRESLS